MSARKWILPNMFPSCSSFCFTFVWAKGFEGQPLNTGGGRFERQDYIHQQELIRQWPSWALSQEIHLSHSEPPKTDPNAWLISVWESPWFHHDFMRWDSAFSSWLIWVLSVKTYQNRAWHRWTKAVKIQWASWDKHWSIYGMSTTGDCISLVQDFVHSSTGRRVYVPQKLGVRWSETLYRDYSTTHELGNSPSWEYRFQDTVFAFRFETTHGGWRFLFRILLGWLVKCITIL